MTQPRNVPNLRVAEGYVRNLQPFRMTARSTYSGERLPNGSFHAQDYPDGYAGQLPAEWEHVLRSVAVIYVVYSYQTPIGWVTADGVATVPDVQYSATTSQHQAILRQVWGRENVIGTPPVVPDAQPEPEPGPEPEGILF